MAVNARVKGTNQFFQATRDLGVDGRQYELAVLPLRADRTYRGHLFVDGIISENNPGIVKYTRYETGYFAGFELEAVAVDKMRLDLP
jgi:hypothetical protein